MSVQGEIATSARGSSVPRSRSATAVSTVERGARGLTCDRAQRSRRRELLIRSDRVLGRRRAGVLGCDPVVERHHLGARADRDQRRHRQLELQIGEHEAATVQVQHLPAVAAPVTGEPQRRSTGDGERFDRHAFGCRVGRGRRVEARSRLCDVGRAEPEHLDGRQELFDSGVHRAQRRCAPRGPWGPASAGRPRDPDRVPGQSAAAKLTGTDTSADALTAPLPG